MSASTKDVSVFKSMDPHWLMWAAMPLDNRQTEWFPRRDYAMRHAKRLAKASGGVVIVREGGAS